MDITTKKKYIISEAENLDLDEKLHVLNILRQHIPIRSVKQHADGCRINLDKLNADVINKIHYIILTKIKASHSNFLTIE
jgi:ATP-dependent RNA circularization protein (DNA/RNA ligase family)